MGSSRSNAPATWDSAWIDFSGVAQDWSGYQSLDLDVYVDAKQPVTVAVLIGDADWQQPGKQTYWNRYNGSFALRPGANTLSIPLGGLYRGEVGSRYNDLKTSIDIGHIRRFGVSFAPPGPAARSTWITCGSPAAGASRGVYAFDFGPENQAVEPRASRPSLPRTCIPARGAGASCAPHRVGEAWDVTFPTRLLQDSIDMQDATFRVKLAPGRYHALAFFEPLGYWDGEQAQFTQRTLFGLGWRVTQQGSPWGKLDMVYRFQDTEPLPGFDLWKTYLADLFKPDRDRRRFPRGTVRVLRGRRRPQRPPPRRADHLPRRRCRGRRLGEEGRGRAGGRTRAARGGVAAAGDGASATGDAIR